MKIDNFMMMIKRLPERAGEHDMYTGPLNVRNCLPELEMLFEHFTLKKVVLTFDETGDQYIITKKGKHERYKSDRKG